MWQNPSSRKGKWIGWATIASLRSDLLFYFLDQCYFYYTVLPPSCRHWHIWGPVREICLASFDRKADQKRQNILIPTVTLMFSKNGEKSCSSKRCLGNVAGKREDVGVQNKYYYSLFILSISILVGVEQNIFMESYIVYMRIRRGQCHWLCLDDRAVVAWNSIWELGDF